MQDCHVLVAGPEGPAASVVKALRGRGLRAWSDRLSRVVYDSVSLSWADVVVFFDEPGISGDSSRLARVDTPKVLLSSRPMSVADRARLIEEHGFDFVLAWPSPPELIAAFVERAAHRRVLPLRFRVEA